MEKPLHCFITSVLLVGVAVPASGSGTPQLDVSVLQASGLEYSDDVLWTATCLSDFCCTRKCISDNRCVGFTTSETSSACRGYSTNPIKVGSSSSSSSGAKLYLLMSRTEVFAPHLDVPTRIDVINKTTAVTSNDMSVTHTAGITAQAEAATTFTDAVTSASVTMTSDDVDSGVAQVTMPQLSSMGTPKNSPGLLNGQGSTQNPGPQNLGPQNPIYPGSWRDVSCSNVAECPALSNVECYSGKCVCSPGYYYSSFYNTCGATCTSLMSCQEGVDPHACMEEYKDAKWSSNNNVITRTEGITSPSACANHCTQSSSCRSAVFSPDVCYTFSTAKLDEPENWQQPINNVYYFQRLCQ